MLRPTLPEYDYSLVVRTDFSDDMAWESVCRSIREPQTGNGFQASVECISDNACLGVTAEDIASFLPAGSERTIIFLVDSQTLAHPEHPVLVVDLREDPGRSFRVVPSQMWGVENNLRLANMDFADFADAVATDGIFRGFPRA